MCGRTALIANIDELRAMFGLDEVPELEPHYNVPPSRPVAVIRRPRELELLRWGLVPPWAKDVKAGNVLALARVETIATTPAFRDAVRRRRCLVVVSGFYEWRRAGRQEHAAPFFIRRRDDQPFALAGVWERFVSSDGEVVESCAIVTQPAAPPLDAIHDRMPLVLERATWGRWIDRDVEDPSAMLVRRPSPELFATAVDRHVNDARHDDPECMRPAEEPKQREMFD